MTQNLCGHLVATIKKNDSEAYSVFIRGRRDCRIIEVRHCSTDSNTGKLIPSHNGLAFNAKLLPNIFAACSKAVQVTGDEQWREELPMLVARFPEMGAEHDLSSMTDSDLEDLCNYLRAYAANIDKR